MRYTDEDHPDHLLLSKSLAKAQMVLTATNEAVRQQETELRLATLSDVLEFGDGDAVSCFSRQSRQAWRLNLSPLAHLSA